MAILWRTVVPTFHLKKKTVGFIDCPFLLLRIGIAFQFDASFNNHINKKGRITRLLFKNPYL
jgi:hypothetical protein